MSEIKTKFRNSTNHFTFITTPQAKLNLENMTDKQKAKYLDWFYKFLTEPEPPIEE